MTRARGVADYGYYPPVNNNILINPSFTVNQRGDVIDHNTASYGPDRWRVSGISDTGGTMSQSTTTIDPATGINKLLVKHRNATGPSYIRQYIEAVNLQGLYSKEMTLSFGYSDVSGSGIPWVRVGSWDSSGDFKELYHEAPTSLGDNRWTCTFTLSTKDGTIPDPSERGLDVLIWPNEKNNAPSEWSLWETKLEAGSVVTPFIARSHGEELALCQRYYYQPANLAGTNRYGIWQGRTVNAENYNNTFTLPVSMRASPTLTAAIGDDADFDSASLKVGDLSNQTGRVYCRANATSDAGYYYYSITADAEL